MTGELRDLLGALEEASSSETTSIALSCGSVIYCVQCVTNPAIYFIALGFLFFSPVHTHMCCLLECCFSNTASFGEHSLSDWGLTLIDAVYLT